MRALAVLALLLVQGAPVSRTSGAIAGQVRLKDGTPARDVRVSALEASASGAADGTGSMLAGSTLTDADGRFRMEDVPEGRYYITAGYLEFPTYYPGVASIGDARVVTVAPAGVISAVDFQLVRSIGVKISGRVMGAPAGALRGALNVSLRQTQRPLAGTPTVLVAAQADGVFEFQKVLPGNYNLQLVPGPSMNITVGESDFNDLEFNAPPMFFGRIQVDDGDRPPRFEQVRIEAQRHGVSAPRARPASAVSTDGAFVIFDVTEEYRFVVTALPLGFRVKSMTMGSVDLTKASARPPVPGAGDDSEIRVVLTGAPEPDERTISGRLATIAAQPRAPGPIEIQGISARGEYRIGGAEVREDGSFEIRRVPPGQYRIGSSNGVGAVVVVQDRDIRVELSSDLVPSISPSCVDGSVGIVRLDDWSPLPLSAGWIQLGINGNSVIPDDGLLCPSLNVAVLKGFLNPGQNPVEVMRLPLNYYVKSLTFGGVDVARAPAVPGENQPNPKFEVVLAKGRPDTMGRGIRVSGRITNADLPFSADVRLTLSLVSTDDGLYRGGQREVTVNRRTGAFEVEGLSRGGYRLAVSVVRGPRGNPDFHQVIKAFGLGAEIDVAASFQDFAVKFDVGEADVTGLELRFEPKLKTDKSEIAAPTKLSSLVSFAGVVRGVEGVIQPFELRFTTRDGQVTRAVSVSGGAFTVQLPEGEYRATVSGLPDGYAAASVNAGPLDLTEPFLVNSGGIADRFTGKPVVRVQSPASASDAITVRLTAR
jgi:hypothetical protein